MSFEGHKNNLLNFDLKPRIYKVVNLLICFLASRVHEYGGLTEFLLTFLDRRNCLEEDFLSAATSISSWVEEPNQRLVFLQLQLKLLSPHC